MWKELFEEYIWSLHEKPFSGEFFDFSTEEKESFFLLLLSTFWNLKKVFLKFLKLVKIIYNLLFFSLFIVNVDAKLLIRLFRDIMI